MNLRGTATMATLTPPVEGQVLLHGVSWEAYERLLNEHQHSPGTHFIYDEGELEIMVVSRDHEHPNRVLAKLVDVIAEELGVNLYELGSTTFKRKRLQKGFEPDSAFYFGANAEKAKTRDSATDSDFPPDLIIEVEISTPAVSRFPIFAAFGVPEMWRYTEGRVIFYRLENGKYVETTHSVAIPEVAAADITALIEDYTRMHSLEWTRHVRNWARQMR